MPRFRPFDAGHSLTTTAAEHTTKTKGESGARPAGLPSGCRRPTGSNAQPYAVKAAGNVSAEFVTLDNTHRVSTLA
jgi:hypothetical protein